MLRNKTFASEFCSLISNWFDMREQAPGANLLHDSVSGASSLVCTEICFAGVCFRSKLPRVYWLATNPGACFRSKLLRVYWLEYLPGSVFRERVSGASSLVCTGLKSFTNHMALGNRRFGFFKSCKKLSRWKFCSTSKCYQLFMIDNR